MTVTLNFQILKSCDSEFVAKLVATFETQNHYYLIQQFISLVFKIFIDRTCEFLYVVWYGPYHMVQMIWTIKLFVFEIHVSGGDFFYHMSHERLAGFNKSE